MIINFVLWITIALLLSVIGFSVDTWQFWCLVATYWGVDRLSRYRGNVEGVIDYLDMSQEEQYEVKRAINKVKEKLNG
jgi:hypothetical protein